MLSRIVDEALISSSLLHSISSLQHARIVASRRPLTSDSRPNAHTLALELARTHTVTPNHTVTPIKLYFGAVFLFGLEIGLQPPAERADEATDQDHCQRIPCARDESFCFRTKV